MTPLEEFSSSKTFSVHFQLSLIQHELELYFSVQGNMKQLYPADVPDLVLKPAHELWKKTCFEAFLFNNKDTTYTEINFNIFGEYDFLFFDSYRKTAPQSAKAYRCLEIKRDLGEESLKTSIRLEVPPEEEILIGPSCLLMPQNSGTLYFALEHGEKPDFHSRQVIENEGFQVLT